MSGNSEILREYLLKLGFKVDEGSNKKFEQGIVRGGLKVNALTRGIVGAMEAVHEMVTGFARGMEKLYYSSRLADTTVSRMQAMGFAAKMVGVSSESMQGALQGMARALRMNPGLQGLLEGYGVQVKGRTTDKVMLDMLAVAKKMPFWQGAGFASLFGLDADSYKLMIDSLDTMKESAALREQMNKDAGLDADEAARTSVEYSKQLHEIEALWDILKQTSEISLLPKFQYIAGIVKEILKDWTTLVRTQFKDDFLDILSNFGSAVKYLATGKLGGGGVQLSPYMKSVTPSWIDPGGRRAGGRVTSTSDAGAPTGAGGALGYMFGVAGGSTSGSIKMNTPEGAEMFYKDIFGGAKFSSPGVMDRVTAMLSASAPWTGASPSAAAGSGGVTIQQKTDIHITTTDPLAAGTAVAAEQNAVNSNMTRNFTAVTQ